MMKTFRGSFIITGLALIIAYLYGSWDAVFVAIILGILEISLSFDNAIVNSRILEKMSRVWQEIFLTVGILLAVVGMRLVFPLVVVSISAQMNPLEALQLALAKGNPEVAGTYGYILHQAHPVIAAFGGMFLLMLALSFFFDDKEYWWFVLAEKALYKLGRLPFASAVISLILLLLSAEFIAENHYAVLTAGVLGIVTYLIVDGLGELMSQHGTLAEVTGEIKQGDPVHTTSVAVGRAAFMLFLYLEIIDASFSFDGVIGAFAITSDPIVITLGLGLIGAIFVRSLTVYLVRKGVLDELVYLEHGAHWAILTLALLLIISIRYEIDDVITGLIGAVIIGLSFLSSLLHSRREKRGV